MTDISQLSPKGHYVQHSLIWEVLAVEEFLIGYPSNIDGQDPFETTFLFQRTTTVKVHRFGECGLFLGETHRRN